MIDFMEALGISIPIIQAPMAGVSTPALAAAVSNAGALGSLGLGAMNVQAARAAIQKTKALTARPFHVNVFCHATPTHDPAKESAWLVYLAPLFARFNAVAPIALQEIYNSFNDNPAMLALLIEEQPAVVSFHFGLPPAEYINALHEAGIFLIASATSIDEARQIKRAGMDAVIAQGIEAGGHRGIFDPKASDDELDTLALTRLLVQETNLPVIAAGGIMDGAGIASARNAGAQAVQLGTAFVSCPESAADPTYRAALLCPLVEQTAMTAAISGRPARGIVNGFTTLGTASDHPPIPDYPIAYDAAKALQAAAKLAGNTDYVVQWAGQAAHLSRALPAADLVALLQTEYAAATRSE